MILFYLKVLTIFMKYHILYWKKRSEETSMEHKVYRINSLLNLGNAVHFQFLYAEFITRFIKIKGKKQPNYEIDWDVNS